MSQARRVDLMDSERYAMERRRRESPCVNLFDLLDAVKDPELPELSIWQLGVLQDVLKTDGRVDVFVTPTYSGCPALHAISEDIEHVLSAAGHQSVSVHQRLHPPWSSHWLTAEAREALHRGGIAPPSQSLPDCPQCGSSDTEEISAFAATSCRALWRCQTCAEPFDYFKPH